MSVSNRSSTTNSSKGSGQPPPPFLSKLLAMLLSDECQPYISWSSSGQYIVLRNVEDLGAKMLPKFFRHNKFASFLRQVCLFPRLPSYRSVNIRSAQLHIYGFRKVKPIRLPAPDPSMFEKGAMVFMHPLFLRGIAQEGLRHIKRRPATGALGGVTVNAPAACAAPGLATHLLGIHPVIAMPSISSSSGSCNAPPGTVWLPPRLPGSGTLSSISLGSSSSHTHSMDERGGGTPVVQVADSAGRLNMRPASPTGAPSPAPGGGGGRLAPWGVGITGLQAQAIQGIPHAGVAANVGGGGAPAHPLAPYFGMVDSLDGQAMTLPLRPPGSRAASEVNEDDSTGHSTPTSAGLGAPFIPGLGGGGNRATSISSHSLSSASGTSRPATPSARWADALGLPSVGAGHGLAAQLLAPGGSLARALDAPAQQPEHRQMPQMVPPPDTTTHSGSGGQVGGSKRGPGERAASSGGGGKRSRKGGKGGKGLAATDPSTSMRQTAEAVAAGEALVTSMEQGNEHMALTVMSLWQRVGEMQAGVVAAQALVQRLLRGSSDAVVDDALQEKLSSLG